MKVVFFVNVIRQARCIRRIEDFIKNGYEVEVYGFDRVGDNRKLPEFAHKIIGEVSSSVSYVTRLQMMRQAIKRVIQKKSDDTLYFVFNLDVALAFILAGGRKKKYIYEVSDLMELEISNVLISHLLVIINRNIITHSFETIFTSHGFVEFFYGKNIPTNISVIPNKLHSKVLSLPHATPKEMSLQNLTIGFTGAIRNKSVYNFIEVVGSQFPNINLRFHGIFTDDKIFSAKIKESIAKYENVCYLGPFKNPEDFPEIYSHIDMVLCLYTAKGNDKILEPNKLYESIFYEKPIIVSANTFTGRTVESLGVGYQVDGEDRGAISSFLQSLNLEDYKKHVEKCASIQKVTLVDNPQSFFEKLSVKQS